jgi:hypothetical protein
VVRIRQEAAIGTDQSEAGGEDCKTTIEVMRHVDGQRKEARSKEGPHEEVRRFKKLKASSDEGQNFQSVEFQAFLAMDSKSRRWNLSQ